MTDDRAGVAIHESGHAIAGTALGAKVVSCDIVRTDRRNGVCISIPSENVIHRLAVPLAGPFAQRKFQPSHQFSLGCTADFHTCDVYLRERYAAEGRTLSCTADSLDFLDAIALAKKTVDDNWPAIQHLAKWLLANGTASGALVRAIHNTHQSKRAFHAHN